MARLSLLTTKTLKATVYLLFLSITLGCANSARILDVVDPQPPILPNPSQLSNPTTTTVPNVGSTTTLPSGQIPATATTTVATTPTTVADDTDPPLPVAPVASPVVEPDVDSPQPEPETPDVDSIPVTPVNSPAIEPDVESPQPQPEPEPEPNTIPTPVAGVAPVAGPTTTSPTGPVPVTGTSTATVAKPVPQSPPLTFFMHDILGGTHPSARVVTGIIAETQINGLPFTKPNNNIFPISGGVPITDPNLNGLISNNNNIPFLAGLTGVGSQASTILQNSANNDVVNGGNNQPFVTAGQLPSGASLQKLLFGSLTVFDDELTEDHELGSAVVGKAQGFYLASSLDGTSQTIAVTMMFHGGGDHHQVVVEDMISFFGVHRTASHESQIAVVGGTGKYENAKGYATVETLQKEDQHTTDGVDTILQFSVYLSEY